jgi:hypothetical protein
MTMNAPSSQINIYHVAGVDDRERGFNRQIQMFSCAGGFQARLRYELLQVEVDPVATEEQALKSLIHELQRRGYRQLRTQRIFIGDQYLGNQELWVDYADPEPPLTSKETWTIWLCRMFRRSKKE